MSAFLYRLMPPLFVVAALAVGAHGAGCGAATPRAVVHTTVVAAGTALSGLHEQHQRIYREATDALIRDLAADGGRVDDYDRLAAPIDREFAARSEAIVAIDAALYAAAGINDAARQGADRAALVLAARRVLDAIERAMGVLQGGVILPAVPIPPEVRQIVAALSALLATPADGGLR